MFEFLFVAILLFFHFILAFKCDKFDRPVVIILLLSNVYYSFLGPLYWKIERQGFFLNVDWYKEIGFTALILSIATTALAAGITFVNKKDVSYERSIANYLPKSWYVFFYLGGIASLYVILNTVIQGGGLDKRDGMILIAYQFGDMLIPCALFLIARKGWSRESIFLLLYFFIYAFLLGFRYKIALIVLPLIFYSRENLETSFSVFRKFILVIASSSLIGLLFSAMTLGRQKFSGFDSANVASATFDDVLYSFFAESNTIFGLASIIHEFVDKARYIYFDPFRDALLELIPRTLFPGKNTGAYVEDVLAGLLSSEAIDSGTAYPFAGELLLMGGWLGLFIGIILLVQWYSCLKTHLLINSKDVNTMKLGFSLLGTYFGYYYYSRGYFPQSFKGFLFVIVPYLYMAKSPFFIYKKSYD